MLLTRPPLQVIETVSAVDKDEMAHRQHFSFSLAPEVAHNQNFSVKDNRGGQRPSSPDRHADRASFLSPPSLPPLPSPPSLSLSAPLAEIRSKPNQMEPCATSWASGSRCSGSPHTHTHRTRTDDVLRAVLIAAGPRSVCTCILGRGRRLSGREGGVR